jgi:hypothetical protein
VIPLYPFQQQPQTQSLVGRIGEARQTFYNFLRALFLRTGGNSGIPDTVGNDLTAAGQVLSDDYNEILHGPGGIVILANLQGGQRQVVYNGSGGGIGIFPFGAGLIDGAASYSLANGKTQIFTCYGLLANGSPYYRSTQLG